MAVRERPAAIILTPAAEERVAAGRYGICIDCGRAIDYERLEAYPSAKRCLPCQQHREKTRAPSKYTGR